MKHASIGWTARRALPTFLLLTAVIWLGATSPAVGRVAGERNVALNPASQLAHPAIDPRPPGTVDPARNVGLLVLVGTDGAPKQIVVEQSSGLAVCDRAAMEAVSQWRFLPARRQGMAIEAYARIPVHFYAIGGAAQPTVALRGKPAPADYASYLEQSGYLPDGTAVPYATVAQAVAAVASWPHSADATMPLAHAVVARDPQDAHVSYVILGPGSPFHPAVVRRHLVFNSGHLEIRSAIRCAASADACAALREALDRLDVYCGDAAPGCPRFHQSLPGSMGPDALYRFLPPGFTPATREQAGAPVSGLVAELSRSLVVSFACGALEKSPSLLAATRKRAIYLSLPFTNGDESKASMTIDRLIGGIRDAREGQALNRTFADSGLSSDERTRSCDWLVMDTKGRLDRAAVRVTDYLRRRAASR